MHDQLKRMMKFSMSLWIWILLLNGCAVPPGPDCFREGTPYCKADGLFTGRWYDHYERALSCMEGECYEAALSDLNETLARRFRDQRMARTFGMHFVDYFPHRESGLIHYLMGNYEAAKSELELSIRQYPSAKAFFYLDKVRKEIMGRERALSVPRLVLDPIVGTPQGPDGVWTKTDPVSISGKAEDEQYVSEIILKGQPVFMESSGQVVDFRQNLKLDQGRHAIDIIARNLRGGETKHRLIIYVDRSGPVIIVEEAHPDMGIRGYLYDESGEILLKADGKNVVLSKGKKVRFSVPAKKGVRQIALVARDKLGNETLAKVSLERGFRAASSALVASADGGFCLASSATTPDIRLDGWSEVETVFSESIYIKGNVKGQNTIESLFINDTPVLKHPGHNIFFNHFVPLEKGPNKVMLRAADARGNTATKEMRVIREIPEVFKLKHRYCLGMHPFDTVGQISKRNLFQFLFLKDLTDRHRFQIMVREADFHGDQNDILSKQGMPDQKALTSPNATLLGSIYETKNGIEVAARLVDVRSGEILAIKDAYTEAGDQPALAAMAGALSEKFHRAFPLMDAGISQIINSKLLIKPEKWTPEKGDVKMGWPLLIYREKYPKHHLAVSRGSDTSIVGEARIEGRAKEHYLAKPVNGQKYEIAEGDRVVTK